MSAPQLDARVFLRWPGGPARTAVFFAAVLAVTSGCTRQTTDSGTGISVQAGLAFTLCCAAVLYALAATLMRRAMV